MRTRVPAGNPAHHASPAPTATRVRIMRDPASAPRNGPWVPDACSPSPRRLALRSLNAPPRLPVLQQLPQTQFDQGAQTCCFARRLRLGGFQLRVGERDCGSLVGGHITTHSNRSVGDPFFGTSVGCRRKTHRCGPIDRALAMIALSHSTQIAFDCLAPIALLTSISFEPDFRSWHEFRSGFAI